MKLKLGVLIPQSSIQPTIGRDLLDGIRMGMPQNVIDDNIQIEDIGLGHNKELVIEKSQKLILQYDVDIVIGYIGNEIANEVRDYFHNNQKLLFLINLGAKRTNFKSSPYVFYHHFGLWHSAYSAGLYATHKYGKNAITISDFYESGYEFTSAFHSGFTRNGGTVNRILVENNPNDNAKFKELLDVVKQEKAEVLFAAFSGAKANKFIEIYANSDLHQMVNLIVTPPIIEQYSLLDSQNNFRSASCSSWFSEVSNQSNITFINKYRSRRESNPNLITLLTYELMLFLSASIPTEDFNISSIRKNLCGKSIDSPRGKISLDKEKHHTVFENQYIFRTGHPNISIDYLKNDFDDSKATIDQLFVMNSDDIFTGWKNPYLCI